MNKYKCINGHDLCSTTLPSKDCPYCEKITQNKRRRPTKVLKSGAESGGRTDPAKHKPNFQ